MVDGRQDNGSAKQKKIKEMGGPKGMTPLFTP